MNRIREAIEGHPVRTALFAAPASVLIFFATYGLFLPIIGPSPVTYPPRRPVFSSGPAITTPPPYTPPPFHWTHPAAPWWATHQPPPPPAPAPSHTHKPHPTHPPHPSHSPHPTDPAPTITITVTPSPPTPSPTVDPTP